MSQDYVPACALTKKGSLYLMHTLVHAPDASYTELLETTGLNFATMINRLKDLQSAGLAEKKVMENRSTVYNASAAGRELYLKSLLPTFKLVKDRFKLHIP